MQIEEAGEPVTENETETDSGESLMCNKVIRKNRKLLTHIETKSEVGVAVTEYQRDILHHIAYKAIGKPALKNICPSLQLFDGTKVRALGQCQSQ